MTEAEKIKAENLSLAALPPPVSEAEALLVEALCAAGYPWEAVVALISSHRAALRLSQVWEWLARREDLDAWLATQADETARVVSDAFERFLAFHDPSSDEGIDAPGFA